MVVRGRTCCLPGCSLPVFVEGDRTHDFCGRTHAVEASVLIARRSAAIGPLLTPCLLSRYADVRAPSSGTCRLPGCVRPVFVEGDRVHNFCGRTHAHAASSLALIAKGETPSALPFAPEVGSSTSWRDAAISPAVRTGVPAPDPAAVPEVDSLSGWLARSTLSAKTSEPVAKPEKPPTPANGSALASAPPLALGKASTISAGRQKIAPSRVPDGQGSKQLIRSSGVNCLGCKQPLKAGSYGEVYAESFIHADSPVCKRLALTFGKAGVFAPAGPSGAQGSAIINDRQKQTRLRERFQEDRLHMVRDCIDGQCPVKVREALCTEGCAHEPVLLCRGSRAQGACGRTLHAGCCARISRADAVTGRFTCHHCRLLDMGAEGDPQDAVLDAVTKTLLLELTSGRAKTAEGHERFARLSDLYVSAQVAAGLTRMLPPQDSLESMKGFLSWMVLEESRALEFDTVIRQASGYLAATDRAPLLSNPAVKAMIKELTDIHGVSKQPMTIGTERMLTLAFHEVIPRLWSKTPLTAIRDRINLINEAFGALRVGESCNGGAEGHGLDANNTFIVTDLVSGEVTVEAYLNDSKTKLPRWVDMADVSRGSKIPIADTYRQLWATYGLTICPPRVEGGFSVEQPDSWTVKLSLLKVPDDFELRLGAILTLAAKHHPLQRYDKQKATLLKYARERHTSRKRKEEHCYVLLTEGQHSAGLHLWMMTALEEAGLGKVNAGIHLVPAPLLRSTCQAGHFLTPMPFLADSTYANLKRTFEESFKLANRPGDPDPELDIQGHAEPRFGQHSWRRHADKVARDHKDFHRHSSKEIDLYCGWNLKAYDKDMQTHYAGQQRSHRVKRRTLTIMG